MNQNSIEELPTNTNFRTINFMFNEQKYDLNVSLYSNAIFALISYNGKISNLYELNIESNEEQENYFNGGDEEIKDIDIGHCILGKRGNEQMNFISNFIMSYIKDVITCINAKIVKICLSLSLDNKFIRDIEEDDKVKNFLSEIKKNISKIFNTSV